MLTSWRCSESLTRSPESELRSVYSNYDGTAGSGGIEPDYCFYIDNWQAVVGRDRLQWGIDPPPHLVIEIDVTTYTDTNDYLLYGVPEVWLLKKNQLNIHVLRGKYYLQEASRYFPDIDLQFFVTNCLQAANERGTGVAIRELRQQLSEIIWKINSNLLT